MSNHAPREATRIRVQTIVTRADATRGAVLRARVRGDLGAYLSIRFVILILATLTVWFVTVRDLLQRSDEDELTGPLVMGLLALGLTVIVALLAYELIVGQPIHAVATELRAMSGRVAVADLDRFEIDDRGGRADLRAVRRDGRRVDVALGITSADARALVGLLESVLEPR